MDYATMNCELDFRSVEYVDQVTYSSWQSALFLLFIYKMQKYPIKNKKWKANNYSWGKFQSGHVNDGLTLNLWLFSTLTWQVMKFKMITENKTCKAAKFRFCV